VATRPQSYWPVAGEAEAGRGTGQGVTALDWEEAAIRAAVRDMGSRMGPDLRQGPRTVQAMVHARVQAPEIATAPDPRGKAAASGTINRNR